MSKGPLEQLTVFVTEQRLLRLQDRTMVLSCGCDVLVGGYLQTPGYAGWQFWVERVVERCFDHAGNKKRRLVYKGHKYRLTLNLIERRAAHEEQVVSEAAKMLRDFRSGRPA